MAEEKKNRQYNGWREEEETIQWLKRRKRTNNTMAKEKKNIQYNG
jgi:hypothetical protein